MQFMKAIYLERQELCIKLRKHLQDSQSQVLKPALFLGSGPLTNLSNLSSTHIKLLSGSNAVLTNPVLEKITPDFLIKYYMKNAYQFIVNDDKHILREGVDDMTIEELRLALLHRGFNPYMSNEHSIITNKENNEETEKLLLQNSLKKWLRIYSMTKIVDDDSSRGIPTSSEQNVSLTESSMTSSFILHATALPELLPTSKQNE